MTYSRKIAIGLLGGALLGVFLGPRAAVFAVFADGFVRLLQMTVLPYVTVSIVGSLGQLDYAQVRRLGLRLGGIIAALWAIALVFALLVPVAFPEVQTAAFFSTTLLQPPPPFDLVALYIPANPFYSLANNIVPAVVLFSLLIGIALIGVERKQVLLDVLHVAADAVGRATRLVSKLTPYGLFAIAANAAGTLDVEQIGQVQVYLATYVAVALFLSLWVLPGLVAALTPIPYRALLAATHTALITAFAAGDLFIVLPSLVEGSKELLSRYARSPDAVAVPDVIVPVSFNFPHTGKLLSMSFILFAAWLAGVVLPLADYPRLALTSVVTFFGSLNAAVPFLLDLFRIPADTFQLFLATGVINSRFGTLLAAVHTLAVSLLGASAIAGGLQWKTRRFVSYGVVTTAATIALLVGLRAFCGVVLAPEYRRDRVLTAMRLLSPPVALVDERSTGPATNESTAGVMNAIRRRGYLEVGYLPDALPFAFRNRDGDMVGLDMDLAHRLAADLDVRLMLVPLPRQGWEALIQQGACDLVMSGVPVTADRARGLRFSNPYLDETLGLVVHDEDRARFETWATLDDPEMTIAAPNIPHLLQRLHTYAPRATVVALESADQAFGPDSASYDAILLPAERGSAWTLLHPEFSVVVPQGTLIKVPLSYPIAQADESFAAFINIWIEMKRKDGTIDALFKYWILGQNAEKRAPRWSILRDVLHWVD